MFNCFFYNIEINIKLRNIISNHSLIHILNRTALGTTMLTPFLVLQHTLTNVGFTED